MFRRYVAPWFDITPGSGIEPHAYLKDALTRLPDMTNREVWRMMPENRAAERVDTKAAGAAS